MKGGLSRGSIVTEQHEWGRKRGGMQTCELHGNPRGGEGDTGTGAAPSRNERGCVLGAERAKRGGWERKGPRVEAVMACNPSAQGGLQAGTRGERRERRRAGLRGEGCKRGVASGSHEQRGWGSFIKRGA